MAPRFEGAALCETAPLDGGWDKAWTCHLPNGHGSVLVRNADGRRNHLPGGTEGTQARGGHQRAHACDAAVFAAVDG